MKGSSIKGTRLSLPLSLSRLLQPHKNFCVCVFVVSARLWVYGSGSAGDKLLSNKEKYKKEKRRKPQKREKWPKALFLSSSPLTSSFAPNLPSPLRTRVNLIRKEDCAQKRVELESNKDGREEKKTKRRPSIKRNHRNACGIAREKIRLSRWTRTCESDASHLLVRSRVPRTLRHVHYLRQLIITVSFITQNWEEKKWNQKKYRKKKQSRISSSWKPIGFWVRYHYLIK